MIGVKLKATNVLSQAFITAVNHVAEARGLSSEDHKAAVCLVTKVRQVLDHARALHGAQKVDELSNYLAENVDLEDCTLSIGVVAGANLSPADTIALGAIIKGE